MRKVVKGGMTMAEYIERKAADNALSLSAANDKDKNRRTCVCAVLVVVGAKER